MEDTERLRACREADNRAPSLIRHRTIKRQHLPVA